MTAFSRVLDAILKDDPGVGDVHIDTAIGNSGKPKRRLLGKADRSLSCHDATTSKVPFPYDGGALSNLRPDQMPRFLGCLTDSDKLETKSVPLDSLTAIQNRVSTGKVNAIRQSGAGGGELPVVVRMSGKNYIADGHHRLVAAWLNGDETADVRFKDLSPMSNAMKSQWETTATVVKSAPTGRELWAWASVVEKDGQPVVDSQGDVIDPADLEKAADDFMAKSRDVGLMHQTTGHGRVVQSMVFSKELQAALGIDLGKVGWLVKMEITDPAMQKRVASGELRELSIGGRGIRTEI